MKDITIKIGEKIKRLRQERHLSIQKLAELSGVSPAGIYKIENDDMVPSVITMIRVAHALGRKVGDFLDEALDELKEYELIRKRDRTTLYSNENGFRVETIAWRIQDWKMFGAVVTLDPGAETVKEKVTHEGEEMILCLRGEIEFSLGNETITLKRGDSVHYKCTRPHSWRNRGKVRAEMVYFLTPPIFHPEVSFADDLKKLGQD